MPPVGVGAFARTPGRPALGISLPLLYFLIHGVLMTIERALAARGHPITGRAGQAWTIVWILLPLPILFHQPFLRGIVWPLIGIR